MRYDIHLLTAQRALCEDRRQIRKSLKMKRGYETTVGYRMVKLFRAFTEHIPGTNLVMKNII
jgi:hypothetical protein